MFCDRRRSGVLVAALVTSRITARVGRRADARAVGDRLQPAGPARRARHGPSSIFACPGAVRARRRVLRRRWNINQVSLRQAITPPRMQGRMNATMRFIVWGTIPLGAIIGGVLGDIIGLHATIWVGRDRVVPAGVPCPRRRSTMPAVAMPEPVATTDAAAWRRPMSHRDDGTAHRTCRPSARRRRDAGQSPGRASGCGRRARGRPRSPARSRRRRGGRRPSPGRSSGRAPASGPRAPCRRRRRPSRRAGCSRSRRRRRGGSRPRSPRPRC